MTRWLQPTGLARQFALLLFMALIGVNAIAALLMAHEGSVYDRSVRIQMDMGRLVALVAAIEEVDARTSAAILESSSTGYTRFSIDPFPLGHDDAPVPDVITAEIAREMPGRKIWVTDGSHAPPHQGRPILHMVSVQLTEGPHQDNWLNSLIYPLPPVAMWRFKSTFFIPLVLSFAVTLLAGLIFIRRMTRPLSDLAQAADAAGRGDRAHRVQVSGACELRQAAQAFNDMQARIGDFDAERLRVLGAVGHDLRTPITSLRIRAEMLDDADIRNGMVSTLDEMTVMTGDLLNYAKGMGTGEDAALTDLTPLLAVLCAEREVAFTGPKTLTVMLRPIAIRRAVGNLLDNARRYATGAVVRLEQTGSEAVILIEDNGPGLPEDRIASMIEPFVRGETSRNSRTGGAGLGLAIARDIALAHGGALQLANRPGGGLRAELHLPLPRSHARSTVSTIPIPR